MSSKIGFSNLTKNFGLYKSNIKNLMKNSQLNNPIVMNKMFTNNEAAKFLGKLSFSCASLKQFEKIGNYENTLPLFNLIFIIFILYTLKINLDILKKLLIDFELELKYNNENENFYLTSKFFNYLGKNFSKLFNQKQFTLLGFLFGVFLLILALVVGINKFYKHIMKTQNTQIFEENLSFKYIILLSLIIALVISIVIITVIMFFIIAIISIIIGLNDFIFMFEEIINYGIFKKYNNKITNIGFISSLIDLISKLSIILNVIMVIFGILCVFYIFKSFQNLINHLNKYKKKDGRSMVNPPPENKNVEGGGDGDEGGGDVGNEGNEGEGGGGEDGGEGGGEDGGEEGEGGGGGGGDGGEGGGEGVDEGGGGGEPPSSNSLSS
jgi:hypothetical protein